MPRDALGPGPLGVGTARLAARLHPHRVTLVTASLGSFLVGVCPLVAVVHGWAALAPWHVGAFATSVPIVLWALCLAIHASFFHPTRGWVGELERHYGVRHPWLGIALRRYAAATVGAFALAPVGVLVAAIA